MKDIKKEGTRMRELNLELINYLQDKYPSDETAQTMISGLRDDRFQNWHKVSINSNCFCTDLDFVEIRKNRGVVALIEAKKIGWFLGPKSLQRIQFPDMAEKLGVPFYFVQYAPDLTKFIVWHNIGTTKKERSEEMSQKEYIKFIEEL